MIRKAWIKLLVALTPSCEEVTRLISAGRERPLTRWEKRRLSWHYSICRWCRRYESQLDELGRSTRKLGATSISSDSGISKEAQERLRRTLEES